MLNNKTKPNHHAIEEKAPECAAHGEGKLSFVGAASREQFLRFHELLIWATWSPKPPSQSYGRRKRLEMRRAP